jgi:hypothetical protein
MSQSLTGLESEKRRCVEATDDIVEYIIGDRLKLR